METSIGVLSLEKSSRALAFLDNFLFFLVYDTDSPNVLLLISDYSFR